MIAKRAKRRQAELRYIKRIRELGLNKQATRGNTSWKAFFSAGAGATVETNIARVSINAIINTYSKKMNKKFICSFEEQEEGTLVKLDSAKRQYEN